MYVCTEWPPNWDCPNGLSCQKYHLYVRPSTEEIIQKLYGTLVNSQYLPTLSAQAPVLGPVLPHAHLLVGACVSAAVSIAIRPLIPISSPRTGRRRRSSGAEPLCTDRQRRTASRVTECFIGDRVRNVVCYYFAFKFTGPHLGLAAISTKSDP